MNNYYRTILDTQIKKALADAQSATQIIHPYLTGKLREIVLHQLIEPLLNKNYGIGNGKIIDYNGNISGEVDLCIYSKNIHPPIFFSPNDKTGMFPVESVLNVIEVKSDFNVRNIKDCFNKFSYIDKELIFTAGIHDENNRVVESYFVKPHYSLFGFNIKQNVYSPEKVLESYSKIDHNWQNSPLITNICIAGRGWLCHTLQGWVHIAHNEITGFSDEIIGFLGTIANDLPRIESTRGHPQIGYYLTDPLNLDKLIDRKFVNKPWGEGKFVFRNQ